MIKEIVAQLKSVRIKNKVSMTELSEKTGVSQKHISNIENNKTKPTIETLEKLSKGLGLEIDLSLKGDDKTA